MRKLAGLLMLVLAFVCVVAAVITAINLGFIIVRPDSISVVNTLIGQFVVIVGALVLARILYGAGRSRL
ncbi:MAG: hypothetical protein KKD00_04155 [Gammaproteobacteria bacterium]|nr:hypothetical protein [Gammaproteobacteria bacterium]